MKRLRRSSSTLLEDLARPGWPSKPCKRSSLDRLQKAPANWRRGVPPTWPGLGPALASLTGPRWTLQALSCGYGRRSAARKRLAPLLGHSERWQCWVSRSCMHPATVHLSSWKDWSPRTQRTWCGRPAPWRWIAMRCLLRLEESRLLTAVCCCRLLAAVQ